MRIRTTLRPGQPGTKRFVERFGEELVRVRYRYDAQNARRLTTVELIVDEVPWEPDPREVIHIRVSLNEPVLRRRVKQAGGRWNATARLWEIERGAATALDIEDRITRHPRTSTSGK